MAKITAEWANPPSADEILQRDDERLLADPILAEPVADDEAAFTDTLLATLDARQILMAGVHARGLKLTSVMGTCPPDADT